MTVGSSGSTHSVPGGAKGGRKGLRQSREVRSTSPRHLWGLWAEAGSEQRNQEAEISP